MGFMDKMKNAIGIEDPYYDDDYNEDDYYDEDDPVEDRSYDDQDDYESLDQDTEAMDFGSNSTKSKVVNMTSTSPRLKIQIEEPLEYNDGPKIIDHITSNRSVVLNLEMLEVDKKREIFDFVSGGVYALNGHMEKVTKDIYVVVPKGVSVDGKIDEAINDKSSGDSLYQI